MSVFTLHSTEKYVLRRSLGGIDPAKPIAVDKDQILRNAMRITIRHQTKPTVLFENDPCDPLLGTYPHPQ